jgi:hypothetical protein
MIQRRLNVSLTSRTLLWKNPLIISRRSGEYYDCLSGYSVE